MTDDIFSGELNVRVANRNHACAPAVRCGLLTVPPVAAASSVADPRRGRRAWSALLATARRLHARSDARHRDQRAAGARTHLLRQSLARTADVRVGAARPEPVRPRLGLRGAGPAAA